MKLHDLKSWPEQLPKPLTGTEDAIRWTQGYNKAIRVLGYIDISLNEVIKAMIKEVYEQERKNPEGKTQQTSKEET